MSGLQRIEGEGRKPLVLSPGACVACAAPIEGKRQRCAPCAKVRRRKQQRAWEKRNPEQVREASRRNVAAYRKRHAEKARATRRASYHKHRDKNLARHTRYYFAVRKAKLQASRKARPQAPPVVAFQIGDNLDLAAINAAVPRGTQGREDVCQSLALAILEGRIGRDDIAAQARKFIAAFNRDNFEGRGRAVSLSQPRPDGRSWHDMLPDDERAWV